MKLMVLKMMALFSGLALSGHGIGPARAESKTNGENTTLQGEDEVQWEPTWYHIDDGAQGKLWVRRGIGEGGQWAQLRNQYDSKLRCHATITSILEGGEKVRSQHFPVCEAHQTRTISPQPGQEISKVEVSDLHFCEEAAVKA